MSKSSKNDRSQPKADEQPAEQTPKEPVGSYYYDDAYGYEEYKSDDQDDEDETDQ
jgi:hypothetical protein